MGSLEDALEHDRVGVDGSKVGPEGPELTWCFKSNSIPAPSPWYKYIILPV